MTIGSGLKKMFGGGSGADTKTQRQLDDLITLLLFLKVRKIE
jgi:hypothetical protein